MCGILGGNNKRWDYLNGIKSMHHRGPDGSRVCNFLGLTMAFTRLSVIDLSENGMQPMISDDGNVAIVFNGEIYGYQYLREKLIKKGYNFHSTTDTEVILNAYLEWGKQFVNKIDGMFAIAIYDKREMVVRLYRDRFGIKPLYYYSCGKDFGFSSELKGITSMCRNARFEIDNTAIYDYLTYSYIPEPKTMYQHVFKLEPAHYLEYDLEKRHISKKSLYWRLDINNTCEKKRDTEELKNKLRNLIGNSVRMQMIADVPVGTFLSGGIDSSVVTYEAHNLNHKIETFTIGFSDRKYDESKYAESVADKCGILMNKETFNRDIFKKYYNNIREWYDEPFADMSAFPTYLVSKIAREKAIVVLTGDGGDEVFGGYPRFSQLVKKDNEGYDNLLISKLVKLISIYKDIKDLYLYMDDLGFLNSTYSEPLSIDDKTLRKKFGISKDYDRLWHMRKHYIKDLPPITRAQYLDLKTYLPGEVLTKVDRVSMAVSLETRVPLLAREIVEFSFGLSQEDRCPNGVLKGLLKETYVDVLGREITYRSKQGFNMPREYTARKKSPREAVLESWWSEVMAPECGQVNTRNAR
jgi:asparagine synthase (glutamine-hydrolysing)